MRPYTTKEKARITAGAVASMVIVGWLVVPSHFFRRGRTGSDTLSNRGEQHERKSLLWGSGRGSKIRRGLWFRPCYRDILYRQPFDPLGNHSRHFGLAVCDLFRVVSVVIGVQSPTALMRRGVPRFIPRQCL